MVHQVDIDGVLVDFPFEPYPTQLRYMSAVLQALRTSNNALLESPTGTGKTVSLLCAALAWHRTLAERPLPSSPPHTIIFASRTHAQLTQVAAELRATSYRPPAAVLASRDQLCIHSAAASLRGPRLAAHCRRVTSQGRGSAASANAGRRSACRYYNAVHAPRGVESRAPELLAELFRRPITDIEELRTFGETRTACPYYLARLAARSPDVRLVLLPYAYLIDPQTRASLSLEWNAAVVIVDEAHNLPSVCTEATSFQLAPSLRRQCAADIAALLQASARPGGLAIPALDALAATGDQGLDAVIGTENRAVLEIRLLRSVLDALDRFMERLHLEPAAPNRPPPYRVFPSRLIRSIFQDAGGPTQESYQDFLEMLDRALEAPSSSSSSSNSTNIATPATSALRVLQNAIRILFECIPDANITNNNNSDNDPFRTVVQADQDDPDPAQRTISYWCFQPAIAMRPIANLGLHSLLLTSGTLSPLDSFADELGIPFPIRLENPHVITPAQLRASVVPVAPNTNDGLKPRSLTSAYHARGTTASLDLGRTLIRFASLVPDGLLVFFPSYGALHAAVAVWKANGPGKDPTRLPSVWELLLRHKRIVAEDRDSAKSAAAILAHRANVDARVGGSILLAVCRGKVSEGIDFSDEYGRAVVITGLPYPSAYDPRVVLKREYEDAQSRLHKQQRQKRSNHGEGGSVHVGGGSEWYTIQAIRAVNQAIGRTIRHRHDYGAILLCDERFQAKSLQAKMSRWVRPNLHVCNKFADAENGLRNFFENAVHSEFAKAGEAARLQRQQRRRERADHDRSQNGEQEDGTHSVMVAQQAIRRLAGAQASDADFLESMHALTEGLARERERGLESEGKDEGDAPDDMGIDLIRQSRTARGGLVDSGELRVRTGRSHEQSEATVNGGTQTSKGEKKRSAAFLSKRSGKRLRPPSAATESENNGSGTKVSERIRATFDRPQQRVFLSLFREVLASPQAPAGIDAINAVVKHGRVHALGGRTMANELLRAVRGRVPASLREAFDDAMKR